MSLLDDAYQRTLRQKTALLIGGEPPDSIAVKLLNRRLELLASQIAFQPRIEAIAQKLAKGGLDESRS